MGNSWLRRTALCAVALILLGVPATASAAITSRPTISGQVAFENMSETAQLGSFTTDTPGDTFAVTVDWGDGTTSSGTAAEEGTTDTFDVSGNHTYAEDGTYTISYSVTETGNSPDMQSSGTAEMTVLENAFEVDAGAPITAVEGTQFSGPVGRFQDPGSPDPPSDFTVTIDWGDGTSSAGAITGPDSSGFYQVTGMHTYTDELSGQYSITVNEPGVGFLDFGPASSNVTVSDIDSFTATPATINATDGTSFSGTVATFSDANTSVDPSTLQATIDWGDGQSSSGTVSGSNGNLTVSGNHTYASPPDHYPVTVTLTDPSPGTATATAASTANVVAGQPTTTTQGASDIGTTGATLHGTVNPSGEDTTYYFNYGITDQYGLVTDPPADAGSGTGGVAVEIPVSGLQPGQTYHYQLVAKNNEGTTYGKDKTFTTIGAPSASVSSPAPGVTYVQGQVVDADFTCAEAPGGPGVSSCLDQNGNPSGAPIDTSTPGPHSVTVTATSMDGVTGTATIVYLVAAPPTATISSPASGATFARGQRVRASFSCSEGQDGPGLVSCKDSRGHGSPRGGRPYLDTSRPGQHIYKVTATSQDGDTGRASITYTVIGAPRIHLSSPHNGAIFVRGQTVSSAFSCQDGRGGPGIASCTASPIDTGALGRHTFTITATSKDGQSTTRTLHYRVVRPSNHVTVLRVFRHGREGFRVRLAVPGPGVLDVLESARRVRAAKGASAARAPQPARGRVALARRRIVVTSERTLAFTIDPQGSRRGWTVDRIRLWIAYTPNGGTQRTVGIYGLR
jgi:hypothetical protein